MTAFCMPQTFALRPVLSSSSVCELSLQFSCEYVIISNLHPSV